MHEHYDPPVSGRDQILDLDCEVFPLGHKRRQRGSDPVASAMKSGYHRPTLEVPLDLRIPGLEYALPIPSSESRRGAAHDLHVLLRHRLLSIRSGSLVVKGRESFTAAFAMQRLILAAAGCG
jgi:hypothetical protein